MSRLNLNSINSWVDSHIIDYPIAINLNYNWSLGSSAGFCLVIQILSVAFLAMHYAGETHSISLRDKISVLNPFLSQDLVSWVQKLYIYGL